MNTRFTPLVKLKKNKLNATQRELQMANIKLYKAKEALKEAQNELKELNTPTNGDMKTFLASRVLIDATLKLIQKNQEWIKYEQKQIELIKEKLKQDNIEYEKFKYLELQEIKKIKKEMSYKEAKELDEVALITFNKRD